MGALRITAPSAAAAFVLVDKLDEYGASAVAEPGGMWVIELPLLGAPRETIPRALAAARDWLHECSIPSAAVSFDGHTHLLRGAVTLDAALQDRAAQATGDLAASTTVQ